MDNNINISSDSLENKIQDCRLKVGQSIREIREKRGLNQEQLAEKMQISRSTISKIENGKFNLSIDYLSKFSYFLDFEIVINPTLPI